MQRIERSTASIRTPAQANGKTNESGQLHKECHHCSRGTKHLKGTP